MKIHKTKQPMILKYNTNTSFSMTHTQPTTPLPPRFLFLIMSIVLCDIIAIQTKKNQNRWGFKSNACRNDIYIVKFLIQKEKRKHKFCCIGTLTKVQACTCKSILEHLLHESREKLHLFFLGHLLHLSLLG